MTTLWSYLQFVPFAIEIACIVWIANKVYDRIYGSSKVILDGNLAVAIQRVGLSLGCAFAMVSAMERVQFDGFLMTLGLVALWGMVATTAVIIASYVNDKFITLDIDDKTAVYDGNIPVAVVDASVAFATGLITAGSFTGGAPWWVLGIFFLFGQVILILSAWLYIKYAELEHQWLIEGNLAAGVSLGGMLIATGIVLRNVLAGPFESLVYDIVVTVISYAVGMALLFGVAVFTSRIYFKQKIHGAIRSNNVAFAVFTAVMKVILALAIGAIVIT